MDFADYGVALERFFINTVLKPENDPAYQRFKDLHFRQYADIAEAKLQQQLGIIAQQTEAQKMVIEAQGLAQKRSIEGYTYQEERSFDVAEEFANNEAVGQFANMGVGLGMIGAVGNVVGEKASGILNQALAPGQSQVQGAPAGGTSATKCAKCGAEIPENSKFCPECGEKVIPADSVICPGCGKTVKKSKFCPECGCSLIPKCKNCGMELAANAKFCPECGTKME